MTTKSHADDPSSPIPEALAFIPILAKYGVVAFLDGPATSRREVFRLEKVGSAIAIRTPDGRHLGLFACPTAAALHGFEYLDREGECQDTTR